MFIYFFFNKFFFTIVFFRASVIITYVRLLHPGVLAAAYIIILQAVSARDHKKKKTLRISSFVQTTKLKCVHIYVYIYTHGLSRQSDNIRKKKLTVYYTTAITTITNTTRIATIVYKKYNLYRSVICIYVYVRERVLAGYFIDVGVFNTYSPLSIFLFALYIKYINLCITRETR